MYTLSLAVKSMCCKKADYMHTNLSSLYTTGCSIATSACKAKKAFASLVNSVGKLNISFEYQIYSDIGFFYIIDDMLAFFNPLHCSLILNEYVRSLRSYRLTIENVNQSFIAVCLIIYQKITAILVHIEVKMSYFLYITVLNWHITCSFS